MSIWEEYIFDVVFKDVWGIKGRKVWSLDFGSCG